MLASAVHNSYMCSYLKVIGLESPHIRLNTYGLNIMWSDSCKCLNIVQVVLRQ